MKCGAECTATIGAAAAIGAGAALRTHPSFGLQPSFDRDPKRTLAANPEPPTHALPTIGHPPPVVQAAVLFGPGRRGGKGSHGSAGGLNGGPEV